MKRIIAALLFVLVASTAFAADREVYVYIWSEYIPDAVVEQFTEETGIKVHLSTYDSNEAMYAKVKLVGEGFDLIVPSSYFVSKMRKENMLLPLDKAKLSNWVNLMPKFTDMAADPGGKYSVPYMWGSTAIAVNGNFVDPASITSVEDLWKPELDGKLLLPNDPREVFGLALKSLGYSFNETDPAKVKAAFDKAKVLAPRVRVYDSDSPKQALLSGEVAVGVVWNGEAYIANSEDPAVKYVYPKEGFSLWLDSFAIPRGAKNIDEAHAFLDYILRPDVAATICTEMGYSTPNAKALDLLSAEVRDNPIVYPSEEVLARGEFLDDLGEATRLYDDYWVKLK